MILYVNGDSNSCGTELNNIQLSWPIILAKKLNMTLVNDACPGASNNRIFRTLKDGPKLDVFVVIGWTGWEREEWELNQQYYNVNSGGHDPLPTELQLKYKSWVISQNDAERCRKSRLTHEKIHKLHLEYKEKHIPHLFFNALMNFSFDTVPADWHRNYFYPYDNIRSYYWYLNSQGFQHTAKFHHLEPAQQHWAETMYNYIIDNQLL